MENKLKEYTGLTWHDILSKYLLPVYAAACILGSLIVIFTAIDTLEESFILGTTYGVNALITITLGIYSFIIRKNLSAFNENADREFLTFMTVAAGFQFVYQLVMLFVSFRFRSLYYIALNIILYALLFIPHKIYYNNRHHLFSDEPSPNSYIQEDGVFRMSTIPFGQKLNISAVHSLENADSNIESSEATVNPSEPLETKPSIDITQRWRKDPGTGMYILESDGIHPFRMQTLPPDKR